MRVDRGPELLRPDRTDGLVPLDGLIPIVRLVCRVRDVERLVEDRLILVNSAHRPSPVTRKIPFSPLLRMGAIDTSFRSLRPAMIASTARRASGACVWMLRRSARPVSLTTAHQSVC